MAGQIEAFDLDDLRACVRAEDQANDELLAKSARMKLRVENELRDLGFRLELSSGQWVARSPTELFSAATGAALLRRVKAPRSSSAGQLSLFDSEGDKPK
jgi:hypothetical protein